MKLYLDTAGKELVIIAGIEKIPAIITKLKGDEAAILLVVSNVHRENLFPKRSKCITGVFFKCSKKT